MASDSKLQDQPFQILKSLLERPGQLVTREQLRSELWTQSTFVDFDAGRRAPYGGFATP